MSVPTTGTYTLRLRYANVGTGAALHLEADGVAVTGSLALEDTGGWQIWRDLTISGINLTAGTRVLTLKFDAHNAQNTAVGNINHLNFTSP